MESPRKGTRWANQIDKLDYLIELDTMPRACVYGVFSTYGHETVNTGNTRLIIILYCCGFVTQAAQVITSHICSVFPVTRSLSFSPI